MAICIFALRVGDILSLNIQVFLVVTPCQLVNSYRCFIFRVKQTWTGISETSVTIYHSTWRKMAERLDFHSHRCDKLKFCKTLMLTTTVVQLGVCTFIHYRDLMFKERWLSFTYSSASLSSIMTSLAWNKYHSGRCNFHFCSQIFFPLPRFYTPHWQWRAFTAVTIVLCMGVKLGLSHLGKNIGWGCSKIWCWRYLGLRGTR